MPDYPTSLLAVIDSRIADGAAWPTKMGTVAWRSPGISVGSPYTATVAFDGSSGTAQPVKCFESVIVDVGDRVGLIKYEGEWIITGNYTLHTLGTGEVNFGFSITSTSSATFVDMPSSPTATIMKWRDSTKLRIFIALSLTVSVTGTVPEIGTSVESFDGTVAYDEAIIHRAVNAAGDHRDMSGCITTPVLAGGQTYGITARWRRLSGTGNLTVDLNDTVSIDVREVAE
jgi:hypothetical protein